jgi:protein-S-isoprenylcysteine O-methyltransferase Ste14
MILTEKACQILSIIATLLLIVCMIALYRLNALFSLSPPVLIVQSIAAALMLWARLSFGRRSFHFTAVPITENIITHGAYKYLRHPIYSAIWLFSWAGAAAHFSILTAGLAALVFVCLLTRIICEEACLQRRFSDYSTYAQHTARLIPFIF